MYVPEGTYHVSLHRVRRQLQFSSSALRAPQYVLESPYSRQSHPTSDLVQMLTVGTQAETGRALEIAYYSSHSPQPIPALIPLTLIWKVRRALFHACLIVIETIR